LPADVERNGVPSLHLVAALLPWWNLPRGGAPVRIATGAFLAGTVAATLATGEHYLVDLILTVPFALAIQLIFFADPRADPLRRWLVIAAGALFTLLWLTLLRSGWLLTSAPSAALFALAGASLLLPSVARRTAGLLGRGRPPVHEVPQAPLKPSRL
jgi:PAP2 superfamily